MRFVLAGNERIGYECLKILLEAKQQVVGVITHNHNNKAKLENKRIKFLANQAGLNLYAIEDINHPDFLQELSHLSPDVVFNVAFLHLYKAPVLSIPRIGCINFHPGPLPKYGGSNGWIWAIINGESEYGVVFHYMKERVDAGDIIGLERFPIWKDDTGLSLLMKCYDHGAILFRKTLDNILNDTIVPFPQDISERTYYYNKVPFEGMIDTMWDANKICDFVRAMSFSPFPNPLSPAMLAFLDTKLIVTKARVLGKNLPKPGKPGEVIDMNTEGIIMQTGNGLVQLTLSDNSTRSSDNLGVCLTNGIFKGSILGCRNQDN
jgi:UDP-4-amino-4-deoxy-L-arabinose formyltransferase / UDP-glucuronic acid dehydrogenase (UDP-4-keto-hexauronic acid decarboxylating)